jgi:hypothetical protein
MHDSVLVRYIVVYQKAPGLTPSEKLTGLRHVFSRQAFRVALLLTQLKARLLVQYHGVLQFVPILCLSWP